MPNNFNTFKKYLEEVKANIPAQNISDIGGNNTNVEDEKNGKVDKDVEGKESKETKPTGNGTLVKIQDVDSKKETASVKEDSVAANAVGLDAPIGMKEPKKQLSKKSNDYIKKNEKEQKTLSSLRKLQNGNCA